MKNKDFWFIKNRLTTLSPSYRDKIKLQLWMFVYTFLFRPSLHSFKGWRCFLLRVFGAKIGKRTYIASSAFIYMPWKFVIGSLCSIDEFVYIKNTDTVRIGDGVNIASFVRVFTGTHDIYKRTFNVVRKPIEIGNCVFIATGAFIGSGVSLGDLCVVGVYSVVLKSADANQIIVGIPGKVVKQRLSQECLTKFTFNFYEP